MRAAFILNLLCYRRSLPVLFGLLLSAGNPVHAQDYAIGADLSFLKAAEDRGFSFRDSGKVKPGLILFKDHGYNWIRLRLFHTPTELPNSLEYTLALAQAAKQLGYKFLLDYHYSDTWADPAKQFLPKVWEGKTHAQLVDSVFAYTRETMIAFRRAGAMPDMVQIGNEISNGMLWPDGKLPELWDHLAELVQAGINGVHAGCGNEPCPQIMIHIDKGGDKTFTRQYFDRLMAYGIRFDVIGQSYYPWWHGNLLQLRDNLYFMATTYQKPVYVVEAAYCSVPTEYKDKPGPFPETPDGQRQFLDAVHQMVLNTPGHLGAGVFWWEPATMGGRSTRDFFDEQGDALPVIGVFDAYTKY